MMLVSPLDGSSAMFEGVGTREYHSDAQTDISSFNNKSIKMQATVLRPDAEIATSVAELLSTKQINGTAIKRFFHIAKARTRASNSAAKMIVLFARLPNNCICSSFKHKEKKDTGTP